jgi:hypothetical protein
MGGRMNMAQLDPKLVQAGSCRKAFRTMMWAFVFFVPLPVQNVFPDVIGWILFLIAVQKVPRPHPAIGSMRLLAAFGLALWVARTVAFHSAAAGTQELYLVLYLIAWAILLLFVWKACAVIAQLADAAKADSVAQAARWRRWLCILPFVSLAVVANFRSQVPPLATFLFRFLVACVLCLLMGLMADAARTCALIEQPQPVGMDSGKQAS